MSNKVSVIITTHKGADSVRRAVDSVMSQSYKNIEIIVVDDNGLDTPEQLKTQEILSEYLNDNKIIYFAHKKNQGGSVARNTGFKLSSGELVGFLDDDDYYLPEKIAASVNCLLSLDESWGAVYTDTIYDKGFSPFLLKYKSEGDLLYEMLNHTIFMNPGTTIIRRNVVEDLKGFDETFERHQDYEFFTRLASSTKIAHINMCGSVYSCAIKRHGNISKLTEYRKYYLDKMGIVIDRFSDNQKNTIIAKNILDITGVSFGRYLSIINKWGYKVSLTGCLKALLLIYREKFFTYKCRKRYAVQKDNGIE